MMLCRSSRSKSINAKLPTAALARSTAMTEPKLPSPIIRTRFLSSAPFSINPELRARGLQYNKDVWIGENVWIGAGVIIMPGIHIGNNSVIGAGSIVTRDIPENVVAVGNPCRVLREISNRDRKYFYKEEKIDWENLG